MVRAGDTEVTDKFEQFYRDYYHDEIGELAQKYPNEQRSLYVDWGDLYQFDPDLADDFLAQPGQMQGYAEEALRLYDLPADVRLGRVHVRVQNLRTTTAIHDICARHRGQLIAVTGTVRKATGSSPRVTEAAFECQRCRTLTRIPQTSGEFYEPHECQGCERQGPFEINFDQSEFVDAQKLRVQESPTPVGEDSMPEALEVNISDDLVDTVAAGESVRISGIIHFDQKGESDPTFDMSLNGMSISPLGDTSSESAASIGPDDLRPIESLADYTDAAAVALNGLSQVENVREEETKAKLITPLIEALGWNKYDNSEVRLEYTDEATNKRTDYALFGPDVTTPTALVEAKQLGTPLMDSKVVTQLTTYLRLFDADYGLLTNGESLRVYDNPDGGLPRHIADLSVSDVADADVLEPFQHPRRLE